MVVQERNKLLVTIGPLSSQISNWNHFQDIYTCNREVIHVHFKDLIKCFILDFIVLLVLST